MGGGGWQFVTWLLVVVGWIYVNHTNNKRESRKEARSAADGAKKEVVGIAGRAARYFADPSDAGSDEIKSGLDMLDCELARLEGYSTSNLLIRMGEFHEACTSADFESATRVAHGPHSAVMQAIAFTRNKLVRELEEHFTRQYRKASWLNGP